MMPFPLTRSNRIRLARAFSEVPRVDISIECVLEDQMGNAFVDYPQVPNYFMIEQDQFFCYVAGNFSTSGGRGFLSHLPSGRLLMSGSPVWHDAVQSVFGERLRHITRYSYSADSLSVDHLRSLASHNPNTADVQQVDESIAAQGSQFLEIGAFDSAEDFVQRGVGFCLLRDNQVIGGAYSSLVCSNAIEVSIVVDPAYHRQGIATALSCQLLLWCLEHGVSPHWDAANPESCKLAEKLGYRKTGEYTAYFLK